MRGRRTWLTALGGGFGRSRIISIPALAFHAEAIGEPEGGDNDEERGHVAVPIERHRRAPRHASPLSFDKRARLVNSVFPAIGVAALVITVCGCAARDPRSTPGRTASARAPAEETLRELVYLRALNDPAVFWFRTRTCYCTWRKLRNLPGVYGRRPALKTCTWVAPC